MTIYCELMTCSGAATARHPRDLIVMHDGGGGGGHGGHGGHGGDWGGDGWWGGDGGGGWNWATKIVFVFILGYIVLTSLGVIGH